MCHPTQGYAGTFRNERSDGQGGSAAPQLRTGALGLLEVIGQSLAAITTWRVMVPVPDSSLHALTEADFECVIALARRIWLSHYIKIVSREQIEYMMNARLTTLNLRRYLHADDRWFDVLRPHDEPVGYCSYALTATAGEIKLEQLYLSPELHGRGLGGLMLRHVQSRAQALGCRTMVLQVNKQNTGPVTVYRAAGFTVREEAVFDIGHGFVMDDYVMEKRLG